MADRPRKYCAAHPCPALAVPGSAYCQQHRPARAPKDTNPFYLSTGWKRFRTWYLRNHPLCEICKKEGRIEVAVMVDHVVELKDGGAPLAEENAQALCWKCHGIKTASEENRRQTLRQNRVRPTTQSLLR